MTQYRLVVMMIALLCALPAIGESTDELKLPEETLSAIEDITHSVLEKRETSAANTVGAVERIIDALPSKQRDGYWTIGIGPFLSQNLGTQKAMYDFAAGYIWEINPHASLKILGESNFSSTAERARFLNAAVGPNIAFLPNNFILPYATTDIGYGFARNAKADTAEGFSLGFGLGFQFFKTTETTLDLLIRYVVIYDNFGDGTSHPAVSGLRLAVNF